MTQSVKKTKKELVSIYAVGSMRAAGWTAIKIARELNVSRASVNRWMRVYKKLNIDSKTPIEKDETAERIERLTKMSWKAIEEGLLSTKPYGKDGVDKDGATKVLFHPDNVVRTTVGMKYLSTVGEFIEKKEIDANINIGDMSPDELAEFIQKNI